jgi:hypothetical protein
MHWIDLSQDRDQWSALVNTVMNLRVPWNVVTFLRSCVLAPWSQLVGVTCLWFWNLYIFPDRQNVRPRAVNWYICPCA